MKKTDMRMRIMAGVMVALMLFGVLAGALMILLA